jgi:predicted enzyme related to lactoylglutathione lyase
MAHGDITHLDIPVREHARAQEFYSGLFGWQFQEIPGYEGYPMWQAPNGVSGGGLATRESDTAQPIAYVEVDSIDDTLRRAEASGGRVVVPKSPISETSWLAVFEDPDGNSLGLYEGVT